MIHPQMKTDIGAQSLPRICWICAPFAVFAILASLVARVALWFDSGMIGYELFLSRTQTVALIGAGLSILINAPFWALCIQRNSDPPRILVYCSAVSLVSVIHALMLPAIAS